MIPESVGTIQCRAFQGCISLKSAVIQKGVNLIHAYAFEDCKSLISVMIPESVESIGARAFSGCTGLVSIVLPDTLVGNQLDYGIIYEKKVFKYSEFMDWIACSRLKDKPYSDRAIQFLYQCQEIEGVDPTWNDALKSNSEIGVQDIIKFTRKKQHCKPAWSREGYQGLSNNTIGIAYESIQFDQYGRELFNQFYRFGNVLSNFLTIKEAAVLACVSNTKEISIRPVSLQSLNDPSKGFNPGTPKSENHVYNSKVRHVSSFISIIGQMTQYIDFWCTSQRSFSRKLHQNR